MAGEPMKPVAGFLLLLNFSMYAIVAALGGWALNLAIDRGFVIGALLGSGVLVLANNFKHISGPGLTLPVQFSPVFFPIGNQATGFFVIFALIAGVVGASAALAGLSHITSWNPSSLAAAASSAIISWGLTILAMGLACKEIHIGGRNTRLRTMEAFMIVLSATQLVYVLVIHAAASTQARARN